MANPTRNKGAAQTVLEYIENDASNPAPERCELCGALRVDDCADHDQAAAIIRLVRFLAELTESDPIGHRLLMRRVLIPHATYDELADGLDISRMWVSKKLNAMADEHPALAGFLGLKRNRALGQKRRREREGGKCLQTANTPQHEPPADPDSPQAIVGRIKAQPIPDWCSQDGGERSVEQIRMRYIRKRLRTTHGEFRSVSELQKGLADAGIPTARSTVHKYRRRIMQHIGVPLK